MKASVIPQAEVVPSRLDIRNEGDRQEGASPEDVQDEDGAADQRAQDGGARSDDRDDVQGGGSVASTPVSVARPRVRSRGARAHVLRELPVQDVVLPEQCAEPLLGRRGLRIDVCRPSRTSSALV